MRFEHIYHEAAENLELALLSLWAPGKHPMRDALKELFRREPLLAQPVFQSTFNWEPAVDDSWKSAISPEVWEKLENIRREKAKSDGKPFNDFVPFKHQAESWNALSENKSIVVTSGTGSGKTECFMYPVMNDLAQQDKNNAIKAIFLYPLNALMEDQKKRLSEYCQATGLRFAVYNGDTKEYHADGNSALPNEIATREEIRDLEGKGSRPEILLTNPSMLEYILVRNADQKMLEESAGQLRWIVIDEAHTYSGSAAVELAYQIKRLLNAFGREAKDVRFACTSATIGGEAGVQSLAEFISNITGQDVSQIKIIGGKRLVPRLDSSLLATMLADDPELPTAENVMGLREELNEKSGMSLNQIWERLFPNNTLESDGIESALRCLDKLCELKCNGEPVLSMRAHFFMRTIDGLYACVNQSCPDVNGSIPTFGHLTTYKSTKCGHCNSTLLELVQCKSCRSFIAMGSSNARNGEISQCEDRNTMYDSGSFNDGEEEEDDTISCCKKDTFFVLPYSKDKYINPKRNAKAITLNIDHQLDRDVLTVDNNGNWIELQKDDVRYCPECGQVACGKKFHFKHFRIPISFINNVISPVLLQQSTTETSSWGKYIAFTDSRQGTAISAKIANIASERLYAYASIIEKLANKNASDVETQISNWRTQGIPEEIINQALPRLKESAKNQECSLSLPEAFSVICDDLMLHHLDHDGNMSETKKLAYKSALFRAVIGGRPMHESNAETQGYIYLDYPALKSVKMPNALRDYVDETGLNVSDQDWRDFLKISLDFVMRQGNAIQPLIENEEDYVRDTYLSSPITASNDTRTFLSHWPSIRLADGKPSLKQSRLVNLLCAGLQIDTLDGANAKLVSILLRNAWDTLLETKILSLVVPGEGYGDAKLYESDDKYLNCCYLDLSGRGDNTVCRIKLLDKAWLCPVTNQLIDTTFLGFSPLIKGEFSKANFSKYRCNVNQIDVPHRPESEEDIANWLDTDSKIKAMQDAGLWTDRHKFAYYKRPAYIAAEHSAQQSKRLLRQYTADFSSKQHKINVLHCSTTMEMGVDIGDIDIVVMDTVPPTAANYLQRVGRAGRARQTKALAFSICNNTPVGQHAFANPMWALDTTNHMIRVRPSQTIIQRHINSFFLREFICQNGSGIKATMSVEDFMTSLYDDFIRFLDTMRGNRAEQAKFHKVFGADELYTIDVTKNTITKLKKNYNDVLSELKSALQKHQNKRERSYAIVNQISQVENENLVKFLSEGQFIPNANMPTGLVTFKFIDSDKAKELYNLNQDINGLKNSIANPKSLREQEENEIKLNKKIAKREAIYRDNFATREICTALNEYVPGQTVVVNEKNYVSAGVTLFGEYNDQTQARWIYKCRKCGKTDYLHELDEHKVCEDCNIPYRGLIDFKHSSYTRAYEPIGYSIDQNTKGSREERTAKRFYEIRPLLLMAKWNDVKSVNMCDLIKSESGSKILFYNVGDGHGFAFCKKCGRAAVESGYANGIPESLKPGHKTLLGRNKDCEANQHDIARNVVFTSYHPTDYTVFRFKTSADSNGYAVDEQFVYSAGVILTRALAKYLGIDNGEIGFDLKQEDNALLLFIYDVAKGGCGYSHTFYNQVECQNIFSIARQMLEESECECEEKGGACTKCLVDRTNYMHAKLLSKKKILDWLILQQNGAFEVSDEIREFSASAVSVYQTLKNIVRDAGDNSEVKKITLVVSDTSEDVAISDWRSINAKMGGLINLAIQNGKEVDILVEYHPEKHLSTNSKVPFIGVSDKFADCKVSFIQDMGDVKTALVVETHDSVQRYFTPDATSLAFSDTWGEGGEKLFSDSNVTVFDIAEAPTLQPSTMQVIREGVLENSSFAIKNYFSEAIAKRILKIEDLDLIADLLRGQHVDITFSDMYVNSALASLMLVYCIDELKSLFGFEIDNITLQLDSPKRKCGNSQYTGTTVINNNFPTKEKADEYTDWLIKERLAVDAEFSFNDAEHQRWLLLETTDGAKVEIRFDHGISGGFRSKSKYQALHELDGSVIVTQHDHRILYYVIITRPDGED